MKKAVFALLISVLFWLTSVAIPAAKADPPGAAPDTGAAASDASKPADAPPPAKLKKYRRSKLTRDEQEGLADRRTVLVTQGEEKSIDLDFEPSALQGGISIGNPKLVAETHVKIGDKHQLLLKPLAAGQTTVTLRDVDGNIRLILTVRISATPLFTYLREIRDLLRDVEGLDIRIVGSRIVIEGELLVPADYGKLYTVLQDKTYQDWVINMATLSPLAMQVLAKKIQEDVNTFAPNVRTRVVNGVIFLEGTVDTRDQAVRSEKIASLYLPEIRIGNPAEEAKLAKSISARALIQNFLIINPPPQKKLEKLVRVTVHFVELTKDYNKIFGFKWAPGFSSDPQINIGANATGAPGASGTSFSATISSLLPKLESAQTAGYARVLKTGTLIVRSGQQAHVEQTTEIPYIQIGQNGSVGSKTTPVGFDIAVTPKILGQSEDIEMSLNLKQVTVVGRAPAANTQPITATESILTSVYVKASESAAVAGINTTDVGTYYNTDDPAQGSYDNSATTANGTTPTDPLFNLLRSKAYNKNRNQFVVFITPEIIENASDGSEDLKRNFRVKVK